MTAESELVYMMYFQDDVFVHRSVNTNDAVQGRLGIIIKGKYQVPCIFWCPDWMATDEQLSIIESSKDEGAVIPV
jgi:hypothetical protein